MKYFRYLLLLVFCCVLLCSCMKTTTVTIHVKKSEWIENANGTKTSVTDVYDRTVIFKGRYDFTPGESYEVVLYGQNGDNIQSMRKVTPGKVHIPSENKSNDRD